MGLLEELIVAMLDIVQIPEYCVGMGRFVLENNKYFVLLALADGPNHGGSIQDRIVGDTLGTYLRSSVLYDVLKALVRDGLIESAGDDGNRKVYRLTARGRQTIEYESRRWEEVARIARQRLRYR